MEKIRSNHRIMCRSSNHRNCPRSAGRLAVQAPNTSIAQTSTDVLPWFSFATDLPWKASGRHLSPSPIAATVAIAILIVIVCTYEQRKMMSPHSLHSIPISNDG